MQAAANGHLQVVELLIAKGADINAKDGEGQTALSWAKKQGRDEITALLSKHGAKE
jgi:serine/threonine-protein phosphatase 6 regulatory ankyrin repeat subunit B